MLGGRLRGGRGRGKGVVFALGLRIEIERVC
jgi:hypothetical protein